MSIHEEKYPDGSRYIGEILDGKKHGKGKMIYAVECVTGFADPITVYKVIYNGDWNDDKRSGLGNMTYPNGMIYDGGWENNKRNGLGTMMYPNGDKYIGMWKDEVRNGTGTMIYDDKSSIRCKWIDDTMQGEGTLNTSAYSFDTVWKDGIMSNKGKVKYQGFVYDCEFNGWEFIGTGKLKYKNGNVFEGEIVNGKPVKGTMKYKNGDFFEGVFENGTYFTGQGKMTICDVKCEGEFMNGGKKFKGKINVNGNIYEGWFYKYDRAIYPFDYHPSKITYQNGNIYEGSVKGGWNNDINPNGEGRMTYPNGDVFEGTFYYGKRGGGKITYQNGKVREGSWLWLKLF